MAITTTPGLPGWRDIRTQHTLFVAEMGEELIAYHDPALAHRPVSAPVEEFFLAWDEMGARAAYFSRKAGPERRTA